MARRPALIIGAGGYGSLPMMPGLRGGSSSGHTPRSHPQLVGERDRLMASRTSAADSRRWPMKMGSSTGLKPQRPPRGEADGGQHASCVHRRGVRVRRWCAWRRDVRRPPRDLV
jgi:hypothetical protein